MKQVETFTLPRFRASAGFTLIELLVVVAIIAILASLLLPALRNTREQGKKAVCLSNMRQIHVVLLTYADDNDGWFPPVHWGDGTTFLSANTNGTPAPVAGAWTKRYFPNTRVLRCPAMDRDIVADGSVYWGGPGRDKYYWTTYRILAGTSTHPPGYSFFFGWCMYNDSQPNTVTRAPCPNLNFLGRSISGYGEPYDWWGTDGIYVDTADKLPALTDAYSRDSGLWGQYGRAAYIDASNHYSLDGENIVFIDGHGEWRTGKQVQPRFKIYGPQQWVYW